MAKIVYCTKYATYTTSSECCVDPLQHATVPMQLYYTHCCPKTIIGLPYIMVNDIEYYQLGYHSVDERTQPVCIIEKQRASPPGTLR